MQNVERIFGMWPDKVERVEGGFFNDVWRIEVGKKSYVARRAKKGNASDHAKMVEVAKKAWEIGVGPKVIGVERRMMVIEWIEHRPWPKYQEDKTSYKLAMKALRRFHDCLEVKSEAFLPFTLIFKEKVEGVPDRFADGMKKAKEIYEELKPWLEKNAKICHGDCHFGNVLLGRTGPLLIDFDECAAGDPFFDVAKLTIFMPWGARLEMLREYLGHEPSNQEKRHFELIQLTLLMVIATIRFKLAWNSKGERLNKTEMDEMLQKNEALPSPLAIPFGDASPKARQLGAIYALAEFLSKTIPVQT